MLWRKCTKNYKIIPIEREVRRLLGVEKGKHVPKGTMVGQWIGISCDEAVRMKPSRHKWCRHRWPLIEKGMHRHHCLDWLRRNGYPIAKKSACTFCPYHDDATWRDMKINDIGSFEAAVEIDEAIRQGMAMSDQRRELFLHRSGRPLKDVDFSNLEDLGQLNMFNNECEGMCGV